MRKRVSKTVGSAAGTVRETASENSKSIVASIATGTVGAAAGVAGGVLLGRRIAGRPRKILGVKVPRRQVGFSNVASGFNDAGKQFGKLAGEVRAAREKAGEIGKGLS